MTLTANSFVEGLDASLGKKATEQFVELLKLSKADIVAHNQKICEIVPTITYCQDFITEEEEKYLLEFLGKHVEKRKVAGNRRAIVGAGPFSAPYRKRILDKFGPDFDFHRCYVNHYDAEDHASTHFDNTFLHKGPQGFISIGSTCIVELTNMATDKVYPLIVENRSFYSMGGIMEWQWLHGINHATEKGRMSLLFNRGGSPHGAHILNSELIMDQKEYQEKMMDLCQKVPIAPQQILHVTELATHSTILRLPELYGIRDMKYETWEDVYKVLRALTPIGDFVYGHQDLDEIDKEKFSQLWKEHVLSDPSLFYDGKLPEEPPKLLYDVYIKRLPKILPNMGMDIKTKD